MSAFDPLAILRSLNEHEVRYVAIGGLAATLHGSPLTTGDLDICPADDRANLERLAAALRTLNAGIYSTREPDGVSFVPDAAFLAKAEIWNLITDHGRLDLAFRDYSVKEPFDRAWKTNCERIIRMCSVTICLVGRNTHRSDAVDWEIRKSAELEKGIMAVYLGERNVVLPRALRELGVRPVPWDIDAVMRELDRAAK